jgi:hypothetical protein
MATVTPTRMAAADQRYARVRWEGFAASADVGTEVDLSNYGDRSVQVLGNFGTGGEITIEGSNDGGTTWATLTDPQGNALVFTAAKIEAITELVHKIRPRQSAGSGADIDVYMFFAGGVR